MTCTALLRWPPIYSLYLFPSLIEGGVNRPPILPEDLVSQFRAALRFVVAFEGWHHLRRAVHPQRLAQHMTTQCQTFLVDLDETEIDEWVVIGVAAPKLERAPEVHVDPSICERSTHAHTLCRLIQHIREPRRDVQLIVRNRRRKRPERSGVYHRIPRFLVQHLIS